MKIKLRYISIHNFLCNIKNALLVILLIYGTDTLMFKTNANPYPRYISWGIICMLAVWCLLKYRIDYVMKNLMLMGCIMIGNMFLVGDITGGYFFKILLMVCGLYITKTMNWETFKFWYIRIMYIISIFSFLCFCFSYLLVKIPWLPEISNGNYIFKSLILTNIITVPSQLSERIFVYRNYGPFWEPGVFQLYLLLGIMFSLFGVKKIKIKESIIFSITILTTFSTAGYILLFLTVAVFLLKKGHAGLKVFIGIIGIIALLYILNHESVWHFVFGKLAGVASAKHSSDSRWYSVWSNLYITLWHPFGAGPNRMESYIYEFKQSFHIEDSFTNCNMFLQNFAIYGIIFGVYYAVRLWKFISVFQESRMVSVFLYLILVMELFNEPLVYSLIFATLIFWHNKQGRDRAELRDNMVNNTYLRIGLR